jgi:glucan endo-1,3-beta-D-glucosidase
VELRVSEAAVSIRSTQGPGLQLSIGSFRPFKRISRGLLWTLRGLHFGLRRALIGLPPRTLFGGPHPVPIRGFFLKTPNLLSNFKTFKRQLFLILSLRPIPFRLCTNSFIVVQPLSFHQLSFPTPSTGNMLTSTLLALAASLSTTSAVVYKGFNYGSDADFETEFNTAKNLVGTSGFTSARLYTMIQQGTTNTPTAAIQAAINTDTALLLGLWASETQDAFNNELAALSTAISQYGSAFTNLIAGISVGSEDLYRLTPLGAPNGSGQEPDTLVSYIGQVRTILANANICPPVGHVDTYSAWINSSNSAVTAAVDFLGMDAYPYYQNTTDNSIDNANAIFFSDLNQTIAASTGKSVWITETGWPVSGPTDGQAVASIQNAQIYWDVVGCSVFGTYNTWWYTLEDAPQPTTNPSFGVVGASLSTIPLYSLTC